MPGPELQGPPAFHHRRQRGLCAAGDAALDQRSAIDLAPEGPAEPDSGRAQLGQLMKEQFGDMVLDPRALLAPDGQPPPDQQGPLRAPPIPDLGPTLHRQRGACASTGSSR